LFHLWFSLVNKLHWKYRQSGLNVLGLSTAFEDFEYNTAANTELLLTEMKLVGATRQALENFTSSDRLSVAVDQFTTGAALATPENIEALTETIPDFDRCPNQSKQHCVKR